MLRIMCKRCHSKSHKTSHNRSVSHNTCHPTSHVQPVAIVVSLNLNLQSRSGARRHGALAPQLENTLRGPRTADRRISNADRRIAYLNADRHNRQIVECDDPPIFEE